MSDPLEDIEITPAQVRERMEHGESFMFVDVREPWERETAAIAGSVLIPMGEIAAHLGEFEDANGIVLYCHHGMRSLDAAAWLRAQGVAGAQSMTGGIDRWSIEVDSSVPRY
ncbi:MAG TPA: rhodanese-like domain-containing protein [Candidatus Acidoferrum sp.]|nr:rhodanese-like domain-containing protein [Candidatus Acidoferrum sp.]